MNENSQLLLVLTVFFVISASLFQGCSTSSQSEEIRRERIASSPQWKEGSFQNPEHNQEIRFGDLLDWIWSSGNAKIVDTEPPRPLPAKELRSEDWKRTGGSEGSDLAFAWLGHSSFLIEIEGKLILVDPVLGERSSPLSWTGPKRFHRSPVSTEALPLLDAILITHDHYDHLEKETMVSLAVKTKYYIVPLGIGSYLEDWGIAPEKIIELDWWETHQLNGINITAAPAQHYSGRSSLGKNPTLWCAWAIRGPRRSVYVSGDSGLYKSGFTETGKRLGPFDLSFLKIGSYPTFGIGSDSMNEGWLKLHMNPEQAAEQFLLIKGGLLVPTHWGTFNLASHPWYEPVERLLNRAKEKHIPVLIPEIGERVIIGSESTKKPPAFWWRHSGVPENYEPPKEQIGHGQ